MSGTVRFHRVPKAPPERVCRAFVTLDALVKWIPPLVQEGVANLIPVEMCRHGWQKSLAMLALRVEPEIRQ